MCAVMLRAFGAMPLACIPNNVLCNISCNLKQYNMYKIMARNMMEIGTAWTAQNLHFTLIDYESPFMLPRGEGVE
jgi:hypothetical protein